MKYVIVISLFFQVLSTTAFSQAFKYHTVAPEENVYRIAQKYDVSVELIYKYNPDARNGVQVGSKLVIPVQGETPETSGEAAVSFKSHRVEKKETLYSLSKQYDVSIDEIKKYNKQLYSKELQNGEIIKIPLFVKGETQSARPVQKAQSPRSTQIGKTREHIILPKETKFGIARKYGMTVEELEVLNPTVGVLHPGIMLKVGTAVLDDFVIITDEAFQFYEVQPQETMYSLTRRFQVEADSLMALNCLLYTSDAADDL